MDLVPEQPDYSQRRLMKSLDFSLWEMSPPAARCQHPPSLLHLLLILLGIPFHVMSLIFTREGEKGLGGRESPPLKPNTQRTRFLLYHQGVLLQVIALCGS